MLGDSTDARKIGGDEKKRNLYIIAEESLRGNYGGCCNAATARELARKKHKDNTKSISGIDILCIINLMVG